MCPVCGAGRLRRWRAATASDPQLAGRAEYALERCAACGSAVTAGGPERPASMYEGGTYAPARRGFGWLLEPLRRLAERDRMRFVRGVPVGARVLEVGAGDGRLVARLGAAGYDAHGIDPSTSAAPGARVERAGVEDAQIDPQSQAAVILWHALEHLDDPEEALRRIHGWLVPGGRLVVAVPNLSSVQARIGGDRWFHQDVPRHRTHFTAGGLGLLLGRAGYTVEAIRQLVVEQNSLGMWQTVLNLITVERDFAFRLIKRDLGAAPFGTRARDLIVTVLAGAALAPIAVLAELLAGLAGRGGTMVFEARA